MEQAAKFAETTQILMNVSEFTDVSQATDTLISAVQAFGYTAETSMDVVDLLNTIGNNYAISTADLAQSLTKSSASLVAAGGDLAEAAALTATANKIIQDADSVGTALKTTSLRLRGTDVKVLEEEGLDSEGAVASKSKLQSKVKALSGVDILTATGEYKSTYEILSEIADVWEKIDDMDQAALLELISGKRNSSVIAAILQNPEELKEAFKDANNASGSALKENEKYLDSIQGKIDQFNNAVQSMWADTLDSDVVKFFVEIATQLVKILDAIGPINVAVIGLFAYLGKQQGLFDGLFDGVFKPAEDSLESLKQKLEDAKSDLDKATQRFESSGNSKDLDYKKSQEQRVKDLTEKVERKSAEKDVDDLKQKQKELLQKQSDAQQSMDAPGATEEAKQDLIQINAELEKTNRELAEAQAHLVAIDNEEVDTLINDRDSFAQEVDTMKAKREELQNAIDSGSSDDMLKLVEIDTTSIDEDIEKTKEKLAVAQQDLLNAEAEPKHIKVNGGLRGNKDRDKHIKDASKEVADIEKDLDALQQKKADTIHYAAQFDLAEMDGAINDASEKLGGMTDAINEKTAAQIASNAATGAGAAADGAAAAANDTYTASTFRELIAQAASTEMKWADIVASTKQILADKLRNSWLIKNAIAQGVLTAEQAAAAPITVLLKAGIDGLSASLTVLWANLWPVLLIMIAVAAAIAAVVAIGYGLVKLFEAIFPSSEKLREKLSGLKDEISGVKDEINSLNSELEATQERMAELLAKDTLTFTEQEELENLQKQNDLLEREIYLLEQKEKRLQAQAQNTFDDLMKKNMAGTKRDLDEDGEKDDVFDRSIERRIGQYKNRIEKYESAQEELVQAEKDLEEARASGDQSAINKAERKVNRKERKAKRKERRRDKKKAQIDNEIAQYLTDAEGIDYESADAQTKAYLDYINNTVGKLAIIEGDDQAKSNEIKRIFNKDSLSGAKAEIEDLVKQLAKDPSNESIITQISDQCKLAKNDLAAVGLSVEDAKKYFTQLGSMASFDTLEGKMAEVARAATDFEALLGGKKFNVDGVEVGLADLFNKEGKVVQTTLSQIFRNTSAQTRQDITKLLEGSYDQIQSGTVDTQKLLNGFGLKAAQQVIRIQNKLLGEQNLELFPNLKDEIDGIIDKFDELSKAIGSVESAMETLEKARAEEAYSGSISIETLENLMQYTDDYAQLVEVDETGAIRLVTNAEEMLTKQRVEKIKANAQAAVQTAQLNLEQAKYNERAANETHPIQNALTQATDWLSGSFAYLGSLIGDVAAGNFSGMLERASSAYNSKIAAREESRAVATLSVEDAQKALDNALLQQQVADAWANGTMQYSSEDASGGNDTKEDVEDDRFQKEMDYWENRIAANQAKRDQIQNEIDLLESQGIRAGEEYYKELIALEEERKALLIAQRNEALAYLGTQEEGSEEWWNAANIVNDLESEIDDATASIQDFADAQAQIKWDNLEEITSRFSDLHDEVSDLRDILQREDMFDSDGNWTESGAAVLGTYVYDLEEYKNELATLQAEIADLRAHPYNEANAAYLKETYSIDSEQEYNDLMTQWNEQQREYVKGAYDTADAIKDAYSQQVDAIEEAINEQIDAYNDYIDVVKEAYDAERELYEFKKDIQKQSKSIAETERKIASLSGSTNAADIAERRKLEAQLAEQRESINDSYYSHANDQRSNALDDEAQAYEESMNRYVEGLRETLEEQAQGLITFTETGAMVTNEFLNGVTATVLQNADVILKQYQTSGIEMSKALEQPWIDASAKLGEYGAGLSKLNDWTSDSGYFGQFKTTASGQMTTPFINGSAAVSAFKTSATSAMNDIASNVRSNVSNITSNLGSVQSAYSGIITTANQAKAAIDQANAAAAAGASYTGTAGSNYGATVAPATVDSRILSKYKLTSDQVLALGYGPISLEKFEDLLRNYLIKYSNKFSKAQVWNTDSFERSIGQFGDNYVSGPMAIRQYAKGTAGTSHDEWAITDEPQFGDELILVPGKDGNLSFMRKGTGVVPADLTANLMEWGQFTPDSMNLGGGVNVNMINNAVNKPEFNLSFEALVKAERIDENTLPEVKKFVQQEINSLVKQMNYAIKGKGGR